MADFFEKAYRFASNPEAATTAAAAGLGSKLGAAAGGAACGPTCAGIGSKIGGLVGAAATQYIIGRAKKTYAAGKKAKADYGTSQERVAEAERAMQQYLARNDAPMLPKKRRKPGGVISKFKGKRRGAAKKRKVGRR